MSNWQSMTAIVLSVVTLVALVGGGFYFAGAIDQHVSDVENLVTENRTDIKVLRSEMTEVREDASETKADVAYIKGVVDQAFKIAASVY